MINIPHLLKVSAAWISIIYIICFTGVALLWEIRSGFMMYALHTDMGVGNNILTLETFISGLVIWNIVTILGVWLFAYLFNTIKK